LGSKQLAEALRKEGFAVGVWGVKGLNRQGREKKKSNRK